MRNFTRNRFPIKNLLIDCLLTPIVESTYLTDYNLFCFMFCHDIQFLLNAFIQYQIIKKLN